MAVLLRGHLLRAPQLAMGVAKGTDSHRPGLGRLVAAITETIIEDM